MVDIDKLVAGQKAVLTAKPYWDEKAGAEPEPHFGVGDVITVKDTAFSSKTGISYVFAEERIAPFEAT